MPQQVHATVPHTYRTPSSAEMEQLASDDTSNPPADQSLVEDIDDLLDEIDSVLEENANEILKAYVQRGGQ